MECAIKVGDESLPQVEELNYLWILFTSDSGLEREMDRWDEVSSAGVKELLWPVVVKRQLSWKAKVSIHWSIFVPTLTCGHYEIWVVTERMTSRTQAAEIGFL